MVIGMGNPYRRDDAAGLEVARRLRVVAPGIRVAEHDGEPIALMAMWEGEPDVVVVDAVRTGSAPGRIHRVDTGSGPVPERPRRDSTHAVRVGDAVELARAMGRLPDRLILVGIEGADFTAGVGLSPPVLAGVEAVVRELASRYGAAVGSA